MLFLRLPICCSFIGIWNTWCCSFIGLFTTKKPLLLMRGVYFTHTIAHKVHARFCIELMTWSHNLEILTSSHDLSAKSWVYFVCNNVCALFVTLLLTLFVCFDFLVVALSHEFNAKLCVYFMCNNVRALIFTLLLTLFVRFLHSTQ